MQGVRQASEELLSTVTCAPGGSVKNCTLCCAASGGVLGAVARATCVRLGRSSAGSAGLDGTSCSEGSCCAASGAGELGALGAEEAWGAVAEGGAGGPADFAFSCGAWPTGLGLEAELSGAGVFAEGFSWDCESATCSELRLNKYFCAPNKTNPTSRIPTSIQTRLFSSGLRDSASRAPRNGGGAAVAESSRRRRAGGSGAGGPILATGSRLDVRYWARHGGHIMRAAARQGAPAGTGLKRARERIQKLAAVGISGRWHF